MQGSKHLMECPACWANKLFQIERNSRRLNRATWNISPCSFSQLPTGEKKTCLACHYLEVDFLHLQSILGIELQLHSMSGDVFGLGLTLECIKQMYISEFSLSARKILCFMIYGDDTMRPQSGCEPYSLADSHLSSVMLFERPS